MSDYSYDELPTYVGTMIDEAINATMRWYHFSGDVHSGFRGADPTGNYDIQITPLGGHYSGSTFVQGGQVTNAETGQPVFWNVMAGQGWPFSDFPSMVSYYTDTISQIFQNWYGLPDPANFQNAVDQTREGTRLISYQPTLKAPGPGCAPFAANEDLASISTLAEKWATFHGAAMNTFLLNYANKLPFVLGNQAAVGFMAWTAVAGEQKIWTEARNSIAEIAAKGAEAMKSADSPGGGGADWSAILSIVGAVALIAAPFTDGLSLAAGAAAEGGAAATGVATSLNAIGVVLQTSSDFVKGPEDQETETIGAGDPVSVVSNVAKAVQDLNTQISKEEMRLVTGMNGLSQVITNNHFDMSNPEILYDDDTSHFGSHDEIKTELSDVTWVADDLIPHHITPIINGSSKAFASSVSSSGWSRPAGIGCGPMGPFYDWESVVTLLSNQIKDSSTQLERAAGVLDVIARDFKAHDELIQGDLQALTNKINTQRTAAYGGGGH